MLWDQVLKLFLLKKNTYGSREQYTRPTKNKNAESEKSKTRFLNLTKKRNLGKQKRNKPYTNAP